MAAKKRRKTGARRRVRRVRANPVNPVNPSRRRRHTRRHRRYGVFARRRNPLNPTRRRHHRRRRAHRRSNPAGVLGQAFTLAAGGALIGLVQPFIGRFVMPYVGASPLTNAGLAFGTGWLLSLAAGMTSFTRKWKDDIMLAGGVVAAAQLISAYVVPQIRARLAPAPAPANGGLGWPGQGYGGNRWRTGMGGIAMVTGTPPLISAAPPPPAPAGAGAGMNGMAVRPGNYGYGG